MPRCGTRRGTRPAPGRIHDLVCCCPLSGIPHRCRLRHDAPGLPCRRGPGQNSRAAGAAPAAGDDPYRQEDSPGARREAGRRPGRGGQLGAGALRGALAGRRGAVGLRGDPAGARDAAGRRGRHPLLRPRAPPPRRWPGASGSTSRAVGSGQAYAVVPEAGGQRPAWWPPTRGWSTPLTRWHSCWWAGGQLPPARSAHLRLPAVPVRGLL